MLLFRRFPNLPGRRVESGPWDGVQPCRQECRRYSSTSNRGARDQAGYTWFWGVWRAWRRWPAAWTGARRPHIPILLSLCPLCSLWFNLLTVGKGLTTEGSKGSENRLISRAFAGSVWADVVRTAAARLEPQSCGRPLGFARAKLAWFEPPQLGSSLANDVAPIRSVTF
jgi:hypothetical protein